MDPKEAEGGGVIPDSEGLLQPLPTFNLVGSVERLDAGLRSLDHCKRVPPPEPEKHIPNIV